MINDLDDLLRQLADAPLPSGLVRLEADVMRRIATSRADTMVSPSGRFAAVAIALIVGIGIGTTSAIVSNGNPGGLAHTVSGANLAPSSLLASS